MRKPWQVHLNPTAVKVKQRKVHLNQREPEPLRIFYESLSNQVHSSQMAEFWPAYHWTTFAHFQKTPRLGILHIEFILVSQLRSCSFPLVNAMKLANYLHCQRELDQNENCTHSYGHQGNAPSACN